MTETIAAPSSALIATDTTHEEFGFPQRRRWPFLLVGAAVGVGATIGTAVLLDANGTDEAATTDVEVVLATAPVETRDLIEEVEWLADLGYGTAVDVAAPADGTITSSVDVATVLRRGDVMFAIDEQPVVVLYGAIPAWRDLGRGDVGPDVKQLETNLITLGYDPDGLVQIDDEFTSATEEMIERWQEDLGVEVSGDFDTSAVIVVDGPVAVTSAPRIGQPSRSGETIASVSARAETATVVGHQTGDVTEVAAVGTDVFQGTILYVADEVEVMALTELDGVATFLADPDADPIEVEAVLVLGEFDPEGAIEVDGEYDEATIAAVERWQQSLGLPVTGETSPSAYELVPGGLRVSEQLATVGDTITTARPVLELSAQTQSVVIPVALADQDDFMPGDPVVVRLPDESEVAGEVAGVGTVAESESPGEDPTIDVTVVFTELVADDLPASEVTVIVAGSSVLDAMVVPSRALVTLAEGGFAVEKVLDDGTTVLVAVETGTFDDGVVEVASSQLQPGDELVVPT